VLSEDKLELLRSFINSRWSSREVLLFGELLHFARGIVPGLLENTLRKTLSLAKLGIMVPAEVIERERVSVTVKQLDDYWLRLSSIDGVPSCLIINVDETGFQLWADAHKIKAVVPCDCPQNTVKLALSRSSKRATALVGITLSGVMLKPLYVVGRKTLDPDIL